MTLSELPEGWTSLPVSELLKRKWLVDHMDGNHGGDYPRSEEFVAHGVPYIAANAIQSGRVNFGVAKYLTSERAARLRKGFAKDRDVLFAHNATVGPVALLRTELETVILGTSLTYYRCDPRHLDPVYLKSYLESPFFVSQYRRMMGQSTRNQVPITAQREFICILPTIPEQQKIAAILSTWDRAIELTEKLIVAKRKRKQALMQQLLTGKMRFVEFGTTPWKAVKLGELFKERRESGHVHLPLLSITSNDGIVHRDTLDRKDSSNADKSKYLRICAGDIGYNTMRMWQGVSALSDLEGIVSPAYTICSPRPDVDPVFMSYLFKYTPIVHLFWRYSQGMVDDTLNLKFTAFSLIKVSVPQRKEQEKIGKVFAVIDKEIDFHTCRVDQLKKQKNGLMQQLLTGRVRVGVVQ